MDSTEIIAYSAALAAILTAVATIALAYYNRETLKRVESQVDLIREQGSAMKDQVDVMEKQSSLMLENIEHDRLVKKYDRVNREMTQLVGPLFARRNDADIFSLKYKRSKRIFISPTGRAPNPCPDASIFDFVSFWDSIEQNIYLNRSPEFDLVFRNYSLIVTDYFQTVESGADAERKKDLEDLFQRTRKPHFIREIEKRYLELSNELKDIESELKKDNRG